MSIRISNVIGIRERLNHRSTIEIDNAQRHKFDTDYDPNRPPAMSSEKNAFGAARRSAVRFRYVAMRNKVTGLLTGSYRAEVIGPFFSRLYGACSFGRSRLSAKGRLENQLARNFGFIGSMLLSDKDEADTVGLPDRNQAYTNASARPITLQEACGIAGQ